MLLLKELTPIGSGVDRVVYPHPDNPGLCIKIPKYRTGKDLEVQEFRDKVFCLTRLGNKDYLDYNFTDELYARELEKRNSPEVFNHLPRCYSFADTDLGRGVVWEYIVDYDGSPCLSLKDCESNPGQLGSNEKELLWGALDEFFAWQLKHAIMLREMAFSNTLVKQNAPQSIQLYHIDAIGCVDLVPLAVYSREFARLRVRSKVHRFRKKMIEWLGPPPKKL